LKSLEGINIHPHSNHNQGGEDNHDHDSNFEGRLQRSDYEAPLIDLTAEEDDPDTIIINPTMIDDHHEGGKSSNKRSQVSKTTPNNRSKQRRRSIVPNTASSMKSIISNDDSTTTTTTCTTKLFDPDLKVIIMTAADAKSNFTLFEDIQPSFVILYDAGECCECFAMIDNSYTT